MGGGTLAVLPPKTFKIFSGHKVKSDFEIKARTVAGRDSASELVTLARSTPSAQQEGTEANIRSEF